MKIAICFSGEPRFVEECYPLINQNIIGVNSEIDFFVHTWYSEETSGKKLYTNSISSFGESFIEKNIIDKIKKLYNPKSIISEKPKNFINTNLNWGDSLNKYFGGGDNTIENSKFRRIKINNFYSFMYSNMKSIILKKEYELENDFKYDWVVRLRFDSIVKSPIIFNNFDNKYLYYQEMGQPDKMISDWINFSSSENMDSFSCIFNNFEKFSKTSLSNYNAYSPESLIRSMMDIFNIEGKGIDLGVDLPRHGKIYKK
jgi:hypothetical protein